MPPKSRFTREEIIAAALALVREEGPGALTARALGARLGCSAKPIFGAFRGMEEVQQEVIRAGMDLYRQYLRREMEAGEHPPYKASGMGYIRFAQEEPELFRLLFMRDRSGEPVTEEWEELAPIVALIQEKTGLCVEQARMFHLEMWVYVHGVAAMLATRYLPWQAETISVMLTDMFEGLRLRYEQKED